MLRTNPYSYATTDHPVCKRLVCGRTRDLEKILHLLSEGRSLTLFGERRIGKTLTLFLIRDIINGSSNEYKDEMWDETTREWLNTLNGNNSAIRSLKTCHFVSFQSFVPASIGDIVSELHKIFPPPEEAEKESLSGLFRRINDGQDGRLVVLFDEIEELLDPRFKDLNVVFQQLNAVIQTCPWVSFVFAGADHWVKAVKDGTSPIYGNCTPYYLSVPEQESIEKFLLNEPLSTYVSVPDERVELTSEILSQTGGKPFYCQVLAYEIAFGRGLKEAIKETRRSQKNQLEDFFRDPPELSSAILCLLAHKPLVSVKKIAGLLGKDPQVVSLSLDELTALGKVSVEKGMYRLNGKLFESWGKENLNHPATISLWPNRLRWLAVLVLLFLAVATILYTHPRTQEFAAKTKEGKVILSMPGSVESGETGDAVLYIIAEVDDIKTINLHPLQSVGMLSSPNGGKWEFSELSNQQRSEEKAAKFRIPADAASSPVVFKLFMKVNDANSQQLQYEIPLRAYPLKEYWELLSLVSTFFAAVIAGWTQLKNAANNLFKSSKNS